jgi:DNA-binding NtrC family response regulator
MLMGFATYRTSSEFITTALERTSRLHATTSANAVETLLEQCRRHLLYVARNPAIMRNLERYLEDVRAVEGLEFFEFGYMPKHEGSPIVFLSREGSTIRLTDKLVGEIRPSPALFHEQADALDFGVIWVADITEVETSFPTSENPLARVSCKALRLVTPFRGEQGEDLGFIYLGLDAKAIRNILSLYDSSKSPVFAFPRNPKFQRYSYFLDTQGWSLFQSELVEKPDAPLQTLEIRTAYQGTLGRPGFPEAFRPGGHNEDYWSMVANLQANTNGILRPASRTGSSSPYSEHFLAYAPVRMRLSPASEPVIMGGVAYEDRSVLIDIAGYKHIDFVVVISSVSVLILIVVIVLVARGTTLGLLELAYAVRSLDDKGQWEEIRLRESGYEAEMIRDSVNGMIRTIRKQLEEIKSRDLQIESVAMKKPAQLNPDHYASWADDAFPEFIGAGPHMHQLKREITKASQVDVDVLIEGETGTGKQLAAEAVHRLSKRAGKPFISINCGELDENLLLDSLFGHVKGAFTDGKGERRGAFLEAEGGTLFLDEIQSASLKVQQSLLRALSMRKVKQLGSDRDIDVNVRLISASNIDLKTMIADGRFREDLYYRLKVITIQTPALREQREIIPALVLHFLKEGERMAGRKGLSLSRGALQALIAHSWPGNIRELKHLIITAAVMAEGDVIQAEHLGLEPGAFNGNPQGELDGEVALRSRFDGERVEKADSADVPDAHGLGLSPDLNKRQLLACEHVAKHGGISSREYASLLGEGISRRTAGYDLHDLVGRGVFKRVGRGPATRYVRAGKGDES